MAMLECRGCSQGYRNDRVPRIMPCGHSVCTPCVEKWANNESSCPECCKKQLCNDVESFPVNYPVMRLLCSVKVKEIQTGAESPSVLSKYVTSSPEKDTWKCGIHGGVMSLFCCTCVSWLCHDCLVMDHPILPRGRCRVLDLEDAMERIGNKITEAAEEASKDIESIKKNFRFGISMHEFCLQHCTKERSHERIIQRVEVSTRPQIEYNNWVVQNARERLEEMTNPVHAPSPEKLTSSAEDLIRFKEELRGFARGEMNRLNTVEPPIRKHLRIELKRLLERVKPIYAVVDEGEERLYARVTCEDQRILVYSLEEGRPSGDYITMPFGFVKKLVPSRWATVFLEIGTAEESFGRVYVVMADDKNRYLLQEQMLMMCTGETGVSYKNTVFFNYEEENRILHGGDYEKNNGTGGKPIMKGLGHCRTTEVRILYNKVGVLLGSRESTRFRFHLKNSRRSLHNAIGKVYEDVNVLESVTMCKPLAKVVIRDCGVVVPMQPRYQLDEINCMNPTDL